SYFPQCNERTTMTKFQFNTVAIAIAVACGGSVMAQNMSKDQLKARKDSIAAEYKAAKGACDSFAGNAKDICKAQAAGKEKVAKAELDAEYKPSRDATYKVRVARAEADYAVAKEKCDDHAGNVKDVCVKQAKAAEVAAKADATAQKKTANAN